MTIKQIDDDKASWAADQFIDYFQNFTNLEEYLRHVKKSVVTKSSILDDPKDDFFNQDIHPNDMEFDIRLVGDRFQNGIPQDYYRNLLSSVSSHNNEDNIPGRELRLMVYEKNTNNLFFNFEQNINGKIQTGLCTIKYPKKIFCKSKSL